MSNLVHLGNVEFPQYQGNIQINMMPIIFGEKASIPQYLHGYIPLIQNCNFNSGDTVYLTIHESDVKAGTSQRRGGIHTEGFNASHLKEYEKSCSGGWGGGWGGGSKSSWRDTWGGGNITHNEVIQEEIEIIVGVRKKEKKQKISIDEIRDQLNEIEDRVKKLKKTLKDGIYMASSDGACRAWDMNVGREEVNHHGQLNKEPEGPGIKFEPRGLYWLTDRTPHEALPVEVDTKRQFFRLVSPEVSVWFSKHNTPNPLGVLPGCKILDISKFG